MRINFYKNLRKIGLLIATLLSLSGAVIAQGLSGVKTVDPAGTGPDNYTTLKEAIDSLNSKGVGTGGVTFNIVAGFTETAPVGGYVLTASGTSTSPVVFQKSGAGANPVLSAYIGTAAANATTQDGVFALVGSDWVTIDGINIIDPNASGNAMMEYGYGLFKAADTNGCWNNTIKNCTITLNRNNFASGAGARVEGSVGIYVLSSTRTATAAVSVTDIDGSNSFNKFYSNTISNVNYGIVMIGFAASSPYTFADYGNDIGGNSVSTGNTLVNYGGGSGSTNPTAAVRTLAQYDLNVSYNTIYNNNGLGVTHPSTLRGMYINTAANASANIAHNTIRLVGGATSSQLTGIENASGGTGTNNTINITNNTIGVQSTTATSASVYGIFNSSSANLVYLNNNVIDTITISNAAATATVYAIYNSGSADSVSAFGNTIGNINRVVIGSGTTIGIYISSGTNQFVKHNTIDGITVSGASGTAGTLYGIQTSGTTCVVDSNTVKNLSNTKASSTSALYGIVNTSSPTNENFNYNTIMNLSHAGTAAGNVYGLFANTVTGTRNVKNNDISNISTLGTVVSGITMTTSSPTVAFNKIYNIVSNNTAPTVSGLLLTSLGTNGVANIYNNMISDLRAPVANSASSSIRAINLTSTSSTTSINVVHNTVYLNASSSGANFGATTLYVTTSATSTTSALSLAYNVFVNKSTPNGTGVVAAYQRSSNSFVNYVAGDKNVFYAGVPSSSRVIFFDGTNKDTTLAQYKTRIPTRDQLSVTEDVPFVNTASTPYDLHISTSIATQVESGALPIAGLTTDIDGDIRNSTNPDIGADEGNFIALDLTAPLISYTNIPNTTFTTNKTLTATITDFNGINSSTFKPRIYFRKKADVDNTYVGNTNASVGWKYAEASNTTSPYSFTIDYSLLNTLVGVGDTIQYFIVAQDSSSNTNVGIKGAQLTVHPTNVALTASNFPAIGTINQYFIVNPFPTTVTVGVGGTYASLTGTGGLFDAINNGIVTSDINVTITSSLNETGAIALNQMTEEGATAGLNKLIINPSAASIDTIKGNFAGGLIRLNGADRVIFDGSYLGQGNYLVFVNENTTANAAVFQLTSLGVGAGADDNTITNCTVVGRTSTASTPISLGFSIGGTVGSTGANKNVHIINNVIKRVTYGIYVGGADTTLAGNSSGLVISGNKIGSNEITDYVNYVGIMVANTRAAKIEKNEIFNIQSAIARSAPAHTGIYLAAGVLDSRIDGNAISKIEYTGTSGYGAYGILAFTGSVNSRDTIVNNMITYLGGDGDASIAYHNVGIIVRGTTGKLLIANNSVNVFGTKNTGSTTWDATSAAFEVETGAENLTVINNIFKNDFFRSNLTVLADQKHYAIIAPSTSVFSTLSNNIYYHFGAYTNFALIGTTTYPTLASFQTASSLDNASNFELPEFVDSLNLHMAVSFNSSLAESKGLTIAGVSKDFDGDTRPGPFGSINGGGTTPDIGADEFDGIPNLGDLDPPILVLDSITPPSGSCTPIAHDVYLTVTDASGVDSVQLRYKVNGVQQTPMTLTASNGAANQYIFTIPPQAPATLVEYSFWAIDLGVNRVSGTLAGGSLIDATFYVSITGSDDTTALGNSVELNADLPKVNKQIGTGTTLTTSYPNPYYTTYWGNKGQYLILASELAANGFVPGQINSLALNVGTVSTSLALTNFTISMANTSLTSVSSAFTTTGLTQVYTNPAYVVQPNTRNTHNFQTPFVWDGTSNVLIQTCFNNNDWDGSQQISYTVTPFVSSVYSIDDDAGVCAYTDPASGSLNGTSSNRPNFILGQALNYPVTWTQSTNGGLSDTTIKNPIATPTSLGLQTYIASSNNGTCAVSDTFTVFVTPAVVPIAYFGANPRTALAGSVTTVVSLNDSSYNSPNTWKWTITPNTFNYVANTSSTSKNPKVEFTAAGIYDVKLVVSNAAGSDSLTRTSHVTVDLGYCASNSTQTTATIDDNIGMVNILSGADTVFTNGIDVPINNNPASKHHYQNFYDSTAIADIYVSKNNTYTLDVASIHDGSRYGTGVSVFIDLNQNGNFNDPGEGFFLGQIASSGSNHVSKPFTVPCTADTGLTRMRIILIEGGTSLASSCAIYTYGETEDYRIRILDNPVHFVSANTDQITGDVLVNVQNQPVIRMSVVAEGCGTINLTQFNLNSNGTTSLSDIANAQVWYTGHSKVFADTSLFGSATPAASFLVNGNINLLTDTNYFWLTYDIAPNATLGNVIDAEFVAATIAGNQEFPLLSAPSGNRLINVPVTYVSSSSTQYNGLLEVGSKNNVILGTRINMSSTGGPAQLNQMKFAFTGTNNYSANISKVSLYRSGNNPVFSNTAVLIDTLSSITDTFTFANNTAMLADSNFYWLVLDISSSANLGDTIDAELISFVIQGNTELPSNGKPAGYRIIAAPYCIPVYSSGTGFGDYLSLVKVGSINDANGASPSPYYTFKPYSTYGANFQRFQRDSVIISFGTHTSNDAGVWIDYDQSGTFEPTEKVGEVFNFGAGPSQAKIYFQVPITAKLGVTRLRVRESDQSGTSLDPCASSYSFGETQDYEINITPAPPGDYYPPMITNIVLSPDSQCSPVPHTITATITDSTSVVSAEIVWSINGTAQTAIPMTNTGGNNYSGIIPASGRGVVKFAVKATDGSIHSNSATSVDDIYQDEYFYVSAGNDKYVGIGQTATLSANTTLDRPFKITEFNLFNYTGGSGPSGNGSNATWPPQLPTSMYDDNIEITNLSSAAANLSGFTLITEGIVHNYTFPSGTIVPPQGVVILHLGSGTTDAANLVFSTGSGTTPSSGQNMGIILKDNMGTIVDAVATNSYTFSVSSGVTSSDWSGSGVVSPSGIAGATLQGSDMNNNSNWVTGSGSTPVSIGFINPNLPVLPSTSVITWSGGLLTGTLTGGSITTPAHPNLGTYAYYATSTNGVCTYTDTVVVNVILPPVVDLGADSSIICGTTAKVLDAGNPGSTYKWFRDNVQIATTKTVSATQAGMYKVTVTNQAGLSSSDSIYLSVGAPFSYVLVDREICQGSTANITLDAGAGYTGYLWNTGATTQTIVVNTTGNYWVTVVNSDGCTATDTISVIEVAPPTLDLGPNQSICSSSSVTLNTGIANATYTWSTGATTQSITVSNSGQYSVIVVTNAGCVLYDTVTITNLPAPVVDLGPDQNVCVGTQVVLNANNAGSTYLWSTGATTQSINVTTAGTYWVDVTGTNGCSTRDSIVITNKALPVVNLGADRDICTSDTITLDAGNVGSTYLWSTGATTQTIRVSAAATYSVTVTNTEGCQATDAVVVTNKPTPNSDFTAAPIAEDKGQQVQFTATQVGGNQYVWNFGDPNSPNNTSLLPNPIHVFTAPGNYVVTLTVTNVSTGCVSVKTLNLSVTSIGTDYAKVFNLYAAPNPFVGNTKINYTLSNDANNVSVDVYDMLGRKVSTLLNNESQIAGDYEYSFENSDTELTSGVYFVKLIVDGNVAVIRVMDLAKK